MGKLLLDDQELATTSSRRPDLTRSFRSRCDNCLGPLTTLTYHYLGTRGRSYPSCVTCMRVFSATGNFLRTYDAELFYSCFRPEGDTDE